MTPWLCTALSAILVLRLGGQAVPACLEGFSTFRLDDIEDALWAARSYLCPCCSQF